MSEKKREILFRGKENPSGEWIEGFLVGNCHIGDWVTATPVHSKTVGQFTGLTDKNGKKVFENDIIVICYETDGEEFTETKRVHYNEKECCWYPMRWEECCEYCDHYTEVKSIEVIGNIHDNPELLKEATDV